VWHGCGTWDSLPPPKRTRTIAEFGGESLPPKTMNFPPPIPNPPAQLPANTPSPTVTLILHLPADMYSSDIILNIPIRKINGWSTRPLKYLRYLGYAIIGHGAPLADEMNVVLGNDKLEELGSLPEVSCTFHSYALPDQVQLTDHEVDNATLTGVTTGSRVGFRGTISRRDGEACRAIGFGEAEGCDAAHIIPTRERFRGEFSYVPSVQTLTACLPVHYHNLASSCK
jgi:hypothetical protein